MHRLFALALLLTACGPDETISGYAAEGAIYRLDSIDDTDFAATATITFGADGTVGGNGPCNTYSTTQTAPYPWFALDPIASTRRACPDLDAETTFFTALAEMTLSEVGGDVLILSNDAGREMVFQVE
ncbi:MAG: META domain-containing protein [Yoonia sp.]|uniref:META domain-containing protein n=1 Tax=Yoonia sp. TaxID=2212373 RepID=UPI003266F474